MKKIAVTSLLIPAFLVLGLFLLSLPAACQGTLKAIPTFPDAVNKIILTSCTPCHTNDGGVMAKTKLNFSVWSQYSQEKQKEKASKIYIEINKGAMPPKMAREKKPETIPGKEQIESIKKWSESFTAEKK